MAPIWNLSLSFILSNNLSGKERIEYEGKHQFLVSISKWRRQDLD